MNCNETKRLMIQYIDGDLGKDKASALRQHLSECNQCSNELTRIKQLYSWVEHEIKEYNYNPAIPAKVLAQITKKPEKHSMLFTPKRYTLLATLSAAAIVTGIFLGSFLSRIESNIMQVNLNESAELFAEDYLSVLDNNPYYLLDENQNNQ